MKKVSVIVPIYNTGAYLSPCIDSILQQTYRDIEIILINNGCTDNTSDIIYEKQKLDSRIRVISLDENVGLFKARLIGVKESTGEYILFVDSDDIISIDWVRLLYKKVDETQSDMVIGDFALLFPDGSKRIHSFDPIKNQDIDYRGKEAFNKLMSQRGCFYGWNTMWNKIYSRQLWERAYGELEAFSDDVGKLVMNEDMAFSSSLYYHCTRLTNVHNVFYYYRQSPEAATSIGTDYNKFLTTINDLKKVFSHISGVVRRSNDEKNDMFYKEWLQFYGRLYDEKLINVSCGELQKNVLYSDISSFFCVDKCELPSSEDFMLYSELTDISPSFEWYEDIKRCISCSWCEVVSFDIFDTLIIRPLFEPSDLFIFLNQYYAEISGTSAVIDIRQMRIDSEIKIRELNKICGILKEDVTLDEIYSQFAKDYAIDKKIVNLLKKKEIELENKLCYVRNAGKELYDLAHYLKKKIVYLSDMYLDKKTICGILRGCGYDVDDNLYLSSEIGLSKWTGNLYKYVISKLSISDTSHMCHIGDNWSVDIEMAKQCGINAAFHLAKPIDMLKGENLGIYSGALFKKMQYPNSIFLDEKNALNSFLSLRIAWALVANKMFDCPYVSFKNGTDFNQNPAYIGYCALGMHMLSLIDWLYSNVAEGVTIHFVSRDGYLIKEAFDRYYGKNQKQIRTNYLRVSRKSLMLFDLSEPSDLYSLKTKIKITGTSALGVCASIKPLFSDSVYDCLLKKIRNVLNYSKTFSSECEFNAFIHWLITSFGKYMDFDNIKQIIKQHFSNIIHEGDVIFDVGYSGRTEACLSSALGEKIESYYIHINTEVACFRKQYSNIDIHTYYDYKPNITGVMREHLMMELAPSSGEYDYSSKRFSPTFEPYDIDYPSKEMTEICQKSALMLCSDYKKFFSSLLPNLHANKIDMSLPFEFYLHSSVLADRALFGSLLFEDSVFEGKTFNALEFWNKDIVNAQKNIICDSSGPIVIEKPVDINKYISSNIRSVAIRRVLYYCIRFYKKLLQGKI